MPWYAMGLSIMATQASAVTFISTTGQSYTDGMRFVQLYFGLPLAMVVLCATAVPIFHRANVYTAYEYLEQRFDAKTRALVSGIFLIQRGLAAGFSLYAPSVVLSVILGWPDRADHGADGRADRDLHGARRQQGGHLGRRAADAADLLRAGSGAVHGGASAAGEYFLGERDFAGGAAGRLNAVNLHFDWDDRYNLWSGLIGGMFLALAYFGCDQSQVQRYLTGKSIAQSRLSLIFNAMAKIPDAVLHPVHRRDGVCAVYFREAAAAVPAGGAAAKCGPTRALPRWSSVTTRRSPSANRPRKNILKPGAAGGRGCPGSPGAEPFALRQRAARAERRARRGRAAWWARISTTPTSSSSPS